jgi:alkaline phosphatase
LCRHPVDTQDIAQINNDWFTAGQATLQARLALQPNTTRARNVILFNADGNGVNTNYAFFKLKFERLLFRFV